MESEGFRYVAYGDLGTLHRLHNLMGWKSRHPIVACSRVLQALRKAATLEGSRLEAVEGHWGMTRRLSSGVRLKDSLVITVTENTSEGVH